MFDLAFPDDVLARAGRLFQDVSVFAHSHDAGFIYLYIINLFVVHSFIYSFILTYVF